MKHVAVIAAAAWVAQGDEGDPWVRLQRAQPEAIPAIRIGLVRPQNSIRRIASALGVSRATVHKLQACAAAALGASGWDEVLEQADAAGVPKLVLEEPAAAH